jgi:outer membrane protein TolC
LIATVSQQRIFKENLAVLGLTTNPIFPDLTIGPYNVFDARIQLVQQLLDVNSIWLTKEASANVQAARLGEDLASEQLASAAALVYIEDIRANRAVSDAQADLDLSVRLSTQAHHQHDAGIATAVDLARADTRVAVDHESLIQAQLTAYLADIRLKRVVGLPLQTNISVTDSADSSLKVGPEEASSLAAAQSDRIELRITHERLKAESYALSAAKADYLPTITARGDYGFSGNLPNGSARTGSIGGSLGLPLFSGWMTHGQVKEATGRRSAAQSQDDDARIQVEEDVRTALRTLSAEKDDVDAAETRKELAERELTLARNRYGTGAGDNIQVVTAQASLADALKSWTDARARYASARVNVAAALGHARSFHL